jgi:hypothetical protein
VIYSDRVVGSQETFSLSPDEPSRWFTRESGEQKGYDAQLQFLFRDRGFNITTGVGATRMDQESTSFTTLVGDPPSPQSPPTRYLVEHANAYAYANLLFPKDVTWTAGLSVDQSDDPRISEEGSRVNPKLGVQWNITDWLRLRGAMFKTVKRPLIIDQTIEPTQIAGFNQFFDDFDGTRTTRYAAGLDIDFAKNLYFGTEYSQRHLQIPLNVSPRAFNDQNEELFRTYLYWVPHQNWSVSVDLTYERIETFEVPEVKTILVPVSARYFHPDGFFAQVGTTLVRQSLQPRNAEETQTTRDSFFVLDAAVGYRLPNRRAIVSLEVRNLLDEEFLYRDYNYITNPTTPTGANARFIPARSILGRVTFNF